MKKTENTAVRETLIYLPISELYAHPDNPRKDLGDLSELAESIKAKGIMQNLTVVKGHFQTDEEWEAICEKYKENPSEELRIKMNKRTADDGYTIIIGHRRCAAAKIAGLTELPCVIVEMSMQDQVATMLLENIQRSDLTVYEQAQGFQMMLNLGDSVESVAEKTGFSQSTVRRRIKLTELDQEKLQKVSSRQISIVDLDKLNEIKDVKKRNEVLETIGTNNFNNSYKSAIDEQKKNELRKSIIATLEEKSNVYPYVEPKSGNYWDKYEIAHNTYDLKNASAIIDKLDDKTEYFYKISEWGTLTFYVNKKPQSKKENEKAKKKSEDLKRISTEMRSIAYRHYEMRIEFVKNYSVADIKKHWNDIICALGSQCVENEYDIPFNRDVFFEIFNTPVDSENYIYEIKKIFKENPEKTFLVSVYCLFGDEKDMRHFDYSCEYEENEYLGDIYMFLEKLGYEMSDEEKQMENGSHPLFEEYQKVKNG